MRDLVIALVALCGIALWVELLRRWHHWWIPYLILALVGILERPEPEPASSTPRLTVRELTVADTRWGRANWPAAHYDLVLP